MSVCVCDMGNEGRGDLPGLFGLIVNSLFTFDYMYNLFVYLFLFVYSMDIELF